MTDLAGFSRRFPCCRRVGAPSPSTSGSSMPTVVAAAGSDAAIRVADTAETCSEVRPSRLASRDTVVVGEVLLAALNELDSAVA